MVARVMWTSTQDGLYLGRPATGKSCAFLRPEPPKAIELIDQRQVPDSSWCLRPIEEIEPTA
jgi:hypothetical protein